MPDELDGPDEDNENLDAENDADRLLPPFWDEMQDETDDLLPPPRARRHLPVDDQATALLAPLAAAQDALARLDARAEAAADSIRIGLIARLALREAAGFLAARHAWVHPLDLALRDLDLAGRFDTASQIGQASVAMPNTLPGQPAIWRATADLPALADGEQSVTQALHLARILGALPRRHDPLADPKSAAVVLGPLGARVIDDQRFRAWRDDVRGDRSGNGRRHSAPTLPLLLAAARDAASWMEAGAVAQPDAVQALVIASLGLARAGGLRVIPLVVWAAWPVIGQGETEALPRLRGAAARQLTGDDTASWTVSFLAMAAEAARAGLRELARLESIAASGARITADGDRRSRLPDTFEALLAVPALTPKALANRLRISPQAATRLLGILTAAGVAKEITGRRSFRAFAA